MDTFFMLLKLVFALFIVLTLMILSLKLGGKGYANINGKRYIKILDRVQISKDNSIVVLKVGERGYLISTSNNNTEVIEKLSPEEVNKIEIEKMQNIESMTNLYDKGIKKLTRIISKDENHEK